MDSYQQSSGGSQIDNASDRNSSRSDANLSKVRKLAIAAIAVIVLAVGQMTMSQPIETVRATSFETNAPAQNKGELKLFDEFDRYVVEDFDAKPTFQGFLPGFAGYYGKPVWTFYVNRGQGMASFGTGTKDYPMLEFNAANKAYQLVPYVGFRTFVRGTRDKTSFEIEPFSITNSRNLLDVQGNEDKPKRIQYVGPNEMEVKEIDSINGITTSAKYIVLPSENFASLARLTKFTNTGTTDLTLSALDGLAQMEPAGGPLDGMLKNMGRTLEGWMGVYHADKTLTKPIYKLSTQPADSASVKIQEAGHYCLSFIVSEDSKSELLPIVYDTSKVFGQNTALESAYGLKASSVADILKTKQYGDAKTSSAFAAVDDIILGPGESVEVASFYGKVNKIDMVHDIADIITQPGFVTAKFELARTLINDLTSGVETKTANHLFNGHVKQMFLDNSLRGGMPTILGGSDDGATYDEDASVKVFHTFSRIHGDLERDYNAFSIAPTYFSQGPGNYRDIAQNRRDDVTFLPRMGSFDVQQFLSYIQADGYEPLTVEAVLFTYTDEKLARTVAGSVTATDASAEQLGNVLSNGPFRPGQLFELCDELNITLSVSNEEFVNIVAGNAEDRATAVFGEGFWADHWDYYLDLIEAHNSIYPDGEEELMYDHELRYFFATATVKPRSEKYVLEYTYDYKSHHVLQLAATYWDLEKQHEVESFLDPETGKPSIDASWQRTKEGVTFKSSPIAKLFLLGVQKFAMRDAYGMGVEYEGGKPGWNDAMNGLAGMVGSGMPETYEMYLLLKYVKKVVDAFERPVVIPAELGKMVNSINTALDELRESDFEEPEDLSRDVPDELFQYWDEVATARETYREDVHYYFSGKTAEISAKELSSMVDRWLKEVEVGMGRAVKIGSIGAGDDGASGIPPAYFSYDITKYELTGEITGNGRELVNALSMRVGSFPMFLESPVRYMKTVQDDAEKVKEMYDKVLVSGLRDEELNMYFLSASLEGQSYDMGRMMAFSPGWLENQSIWTHMSYKYYLQLIRGKLYDQFYAEMRGPDGNNGGMLPFMDPVAYGRSLMECSSFMASSAFPDPSEHGRGFSARLSGSTAEFLSMWKLMFVGPELFFLNKDSDLEMQLVPALPLWLFKDDSENAVEADRDEEGNLIVSFKLFGTIDVTYHNSKEVNLFGENPSSYVITMGDTIMRVDGPTIPTDMALTIRRNVKVDSIDAFF